MLELEYQLLKEFENYLLRNAIPLDYEISKIVSDNFIELIEKSNETL